MKQFLFVSMALLAAALPLEATPTAQFSTVPGMNFSWQLSRTDGNLLLSFPTGSSQIDSSTPADAALLADFVNLPAMTISNLQDHGTFFTATLTPTGPLTIVRNPGTGAVLTASMDQGSSLFIGTNYVAYSSIADDLNITSHVPGYSAVIDQLAAADAGGLPIDISFSGDAAGGVDLVAVLRNSGESVRLTGTSLSGQITAVPVPGALLLAGIGALVAGYTRWRFMS
jgi:hypothetical protein